jgi:putative nucleotidyltransferase with HDIG domain
MEVSRTERRLLARTQTLMVAVSLVPLGVLLYVSYRFVFPALASSGQDTLMISIAMTLVFTVVAVVLGYVLVRRDTIRTIEAIRDGERRLDALHKAISKVGEASNPGAMTQVLLSEACSVIGAHRAAYWRRDRAELHAVAVRGQSAERTSQEAIPVGQGLLGGVASTGRTSLNAELAESDLRADDRIMARTHSSLIVPMSRNGEVVAVLDLRNKEGLGNQFTSMDQQLAEGLARQALLFLDNATFREAQTNHAAHVENLIKEFTERELTWPEHIDNVANLCMRIADVLEIASDKRELLRRAAIVHDLGLLDFPKGDIGPMGGPVGHVEEGARRLDEMPLWAEVAEIVRAHHERMDGSGPLGLKGFAVSLPARILALAEYIDTVTNPASPWSTRSAAEVVKELRDPQDTRFDRRVLDAFLSGVPPQA